MALPASIRRRLSLAALLAVLALVPGVGVAVADVIDTLPGGGWAIQSTTAGGSVRLVEGPTTPPSGRGSLELGVNASSDRALLTRTLPGGYRPWNGLGTATMSTYTTSANQSAAPVLKLIGWHYLTPTTTQFTTLNFVPRDNGTVTQNAWQHWTFTSSAIVWQSNASDASFCTQATKCTLSAFMARYPSGGWYGVQVAVGTGVAGPTKSYVDSVTVDDRGEQFFNDFEPVTANAATATIDDVQWSAGGAGTADVVLHSGSLAISPVVYDITVGATTQQVTLASTGLTQTTTVAVPAGTTAISVRTKGVVLDAVSAPAAPTGLSATVNGPGSAAVGWTAPAGRVDSYWLEVDGVSQPCAANPCTATGLQPGNSHTFRVYGVAAGIPGAMSSATATTAIGLPGAPAKPTASVAGHRALAVSWSGPASTTAAPVTTYQIEMAAGSGGFGATSCTTSPCTINGLTVGTAYRFRAAAVNGAGAGAWSTESDATTAVAVLPAAPTAIVATPGDTTATVGWTVPSDTTNLTGYRAIADPGGLYCDASGATATGCVIGGLSNTQAYTVTVVSRGSIVDSLPSASASVVPSKAPGTPIGVGVVAGIASVQVSWTAPDAGSGIAGYTVVASPSGARCETTDTSCVLGGVAGVPVTVTVVARGSYGRDSAASTPVGATPTAPAVPAAPPASGGGLIAEPGPLSKAAPGQRLLLKGRGFAPHSSVRLLIFSTPTDLVTATADGNGDMEATVTVPVTLSGQHTFVALGVNGSGVAHNLVLPITVQATPLAATGSPVLRIAVVGLASSLAGALLLAGALPLAPLRPRRRLDLGGKVRP